MDLSRKPRVWDIYLGGEWKEQENGKGNADVQKTGEGTVREMEKGAGGLGGNLVDKEKEAEWWSGVMVRPSILFPSRQYSTQKLQLTLPN